jgi:ComF family protein
VASLLDLLFPRACAACGARDPDPHAHLCWDCVTRCRFIQPPFCERCGDPVSGRIDHAYECAFCAHHRIHFEAARSVVRFDGPAADVVRALKYRAHTWLSRDLADLLEAGLETHYPAVAFDAVAFVPLHLLRQRERGFNQAELLARALARRRGLPLAPRALVRVRPTPTQTRLTAPQRAANVHHAFRAGRGRKWSGARLLLVDDVMTTGATVNECARALKAGGAATVHVLTVARG